MMFAHDPHSESESEKEHDLVMRRSNTNSNNVASSNNANLLDPATRETMLTSKTTTTATAPKLHDFVPVQPNKKLTKNQLKKLKKKQAKKNAQQLNNSVTKNKELAENGGNKMDAVTTGTVNLGSNKNGSPTDLENGNDLLLVDLVEESVMDDTESSTSSSSSGRSDDNSKDDKYGEDLLLEVIPVRVKEPLYTDPELAKFSDPMVQEAAARRNQRAKLAAARAEEEKERLKQEAIEQRAANHGNSILTFGGVAKSLQDKYEQFARQYQYNTASNLDSSESARYGYRFGSSLGSSSSSTGSILKTKYGSYAPDGGDDGGTGGHNDAEPLETQRSKRALKSMTSEEEQTRWLLQVIWLGLTITLMLMMILSAREVPPNKSSSLRGRHHPLDNSTDVYGRRQPPAPSLPPPDDAEDVYKNYDDDDAHEEMEWAKEEAEATALASFRHNQPDKGASSEKTQAESIAMASFSHHTATVAPEGDKDETKSIAMASFGRARNHGGEYTKEEKQGKDEVTGSTTITNMDSTKSTAMASLIGRHNVRNKAVSTEDEDSDKEGESGNDSADVQTDAPEESSFEKVAFASLHQNRPSSSNKKGEEHHHHHHHHKHHDHDDVDMEKVENTGDIILGELEVLDKEIETLQMDFEDKSEDSRD